MELIDTFITRKDELWDYFLEHITISAVAIFLAILIAVPIGIQLTRFRKIAEPIMGVVSVIQTIPGLAMFALMVPFFGIGTTPAIVALTLYALLPILRNTYTGILGVDPAIIDAGKGMGMTSRQIFIYG